MDNFGYGFSDAHESDEGAAPGFITSVIPPSRWSMGLLWLSLRSSEAMFIDPPGLERDYLLDNHAYGKCWESHQAEL